MTDTNDVAISQQEEYWNMWQHSRSTNSWVQRRSRTMLELLRSLDLQGPKILYFGCGNGYRIDGSRECCGRYTESLHHG